ncbi:MAG: VWA domain-containing protein [Thermoleophilaceae bacterium]
MHIAAHLDVDLVAVESEDTVSLLLELKAPEADSDEERGPAAVQVVLDRSGSMSGGRLHAAQGALDRLITQLDPKDSLGITAFDHEVVTVLPAGPLANKDAARQAVWSIFSRGSTNLSSGLLRGIQEARRVANGRGATLVLLSDGQANEGVVDQVTLAGIARQAHEQGVTTSTLGVGLHYDEALMAAIARGGTGNALFAEEPDAAAAALTGEIGGLLEQTVQAASLTVRLDPAVSQVALLNDVPCQPVDGGLMIELGDLYAGETRKLVLELAIPGLPALGLAQIAELELQYVELPAITTHTVTAPVHVNVVPGDEAAGRIPDPVVRSEAAFQRAQQAKRRATDALRTDGPERAAELYEEAGARLDLDSANAPAELRAELAEEAATLRRLAAESKLDASRAMKMSEADFDLKSRKRGRGPR